jgi:hypothetical protein
MTAGPVVSNASPLIGLERIGRLDLLAQLFGQVLVPPAVVRETVPQLVLPAWIAEQSLAQPMAPQIAQAALGAGESESISLALELGAAWLVLDDRPARRLAQGLGLSVIGTLGLFLPESGVACWRPSNLALTH